MPGNEADDISAKLRILIVTEDDPLYVIRFFDVFFAEYPRDEFEICAITVEEAFNEPLLKTMKRMWKFYGPVDFVRLCFKYAGVKLRGRSIGALAKQAGIPDLPCESVNKPAYVAQVRELAPDVIVSVSAPEIFRADILESPKRMCINIHSGRLPKYRGMMPNFWQLLHGESAAVITVHEMAKKLDAGDIVGTAEFPLHERDRLDRVITGTKQAGARLMIDVLRKIAADEVEKQPIDIAEGGYFKFPKPEDVKAFRAKGHRLL